MRDRVSAEELRERLAEWPRVRLAHLPTPLEPMPRLSEALGGPDLWVKRDDATGLAFGGNKTRQLEFRMGAIQAEGADCVVAGAAIQSNNCRQLAAACARLGMELHLLLREAHGQKADPPQGNLLLDHLLGAHVEVLPMTQEEQYQRVQALVEDLRAQGRKPYVVGRPDVHVAALAYVDAFLEMVDQFEVLGLRPSALVTASSGATQAGMLVASRALGYDMPIWSVNPGVPGPDARERVADIANRAAGLLGLAQHHRPEAVPAFNQYVGADYGMPSEAGLEALRLAARTEGLILDPVYSSKGMAGLIDQIRAGRWGKGDTVVFLHTGGTPALFAFASPVAQSSGC